MWKQVFDRIDALTADYIQIWRDLCDIESPTDSKEGVDAASRYMIVIAEKYGWQVEICPQEISGDCVCITMNPHASKAPVALSGHMDTVHPVGSFGTPPTRIDGDRIYGPGVGDCKGGIVASFLAMAALAECGYTERPVINLIQSDEEVSSIYSNKQTVAYMGEKAKDCVAFLNTEGHSAGYLVIERKGILRYEFEICGKAAHSASCYVGINAVAEAAHKILALEQFKDPDGITCNCSVIQGGLTPNTVPETCTFLADFRYKTQDQQAQVEAFVRDLAEHCVLDGARCTVRERSRRICMEHKEFNQNLLDNICSIFAEVGLSPVSGSANKGGSDAADMTARGIPCLDGFGVRAGRVHSLEEFSYLDSLAESAKRMAAVILKI